MLILNVWYLNITIKNTFFLLFGVGLYLRITVEQLAYVPAAGACTCFVEGRLMGRVWESALDGELGAGETSPRCGSSRPVHGVRGAERRQPR